MRRDAESARDRDVTRRRALMLVWMGEIWNFFEAGVALLSAINTGSIALLALD